MILENSGDEGDGEGREASHFDGEGRRASHFNAYLYLIQAIYIQVEAEKALGETRRNTMEPAQAPTQPLDGATGH